MDLTAVLSAKQIRSGDRHLEAQERTERPANMALNRRHLEDLGRTAGDPRDSWDNMKVKLQLVAPRRPVAFAVLLITLHSRQQILPRRQLEVPEQSLVAQALTPPASSGPSAAHPCHHGLLAATLTIPCRGSLISRPPALIPQPQASSVPLVRSIRNQHLEVLGLS